jgi:hypothetical protein
VTGAAGTLPAMSRNSQRVASLVAGTALIFSVACRPEEPSVEPEPPTLRRLTGAQYVNTVHDLVGEDVFVPSAIEPDQRLGGFEAVGASTTAVSPRGVEQYEGASYDIAEQALAPERRDTVVPCTPVAAVDPDCANQFVTSFGRRAWRRPLTDEEVTTFVGIAGAAADTLGDFHEGLQFAMAALLQSPDFLFRVELGEDTPDGRRWTDHEMAERLSYLFWNTTPDDALLDAADAGELTTDEGLSVQVDRLLESPRAHEGLRAWFGDLLHLGELDDLYKDPGVFEYMSDSLGPAAREETLLGFEHIVFDTDADIRDLMTTRTAFVDRELAALYDVRAPSRDGFAAAELPEDGLRRGLLGQASYLAGQSHPVSSSATLRGLFIREVMLCQVMPGPPAGVDTSIPPVTEVARTLRERVGNHLADESCASCHILMDPIGLGVEHFDGVGRFRATDNGAEIDASGDIDGAEFTDPVDLGQAIRDHESFVPCVVKNLVRYANGTIEGGGQFESLSWLGDELAADDHRLLGFLPILAQSSLFRTAGEIEPGEPETTE